MLLRRAGRHCARREREKEGGETGAVRRAGGPAGGAGAGPARGPAPAATRGWGAGRERAGQRGKGRTGRGLATPHPAGAASAGAPLALGARGGAETVCSRAEPIGHAPCSAVTGGARPTARLGAGGGGAGTWWLLWPRLASRGKREEPAGGPGGGEGREARLGRRGQLRSAGDFGAAGWQVSSPAARQPLPATRGAPPAPVPRPLEP